MKNINLKKFDLRLISKLSHDELVDTAQKLKYQNNKTIDRLYYKYSRELQELNIGYIRDRITQETSDEKLMMYIQDAYSNLTIGGGGKLGAKELKQIRKKNRELIDLDEQYYDVLYEKFLGMSTEEQIQYLKNHYAIGSETAFNENFYQGSRIERANKVMQYLEKNDLLDEFIDDFR